MPVMVGRYLAAAIAALLLGCFSSDTLQARPTEQPPLAAATPADGYLLPDRALSADDLEGISRNDLRYARNEIFARHGYIFRDRALAAYFSGRSWYAPRTRDTSRLRLSPVEQANLQIILRMERRTRGDAPSPAPRQPDPAPARYDRQIVSYETDHSPGTIVIDTAERFLYLVKEGGKALRYGVGVGREGFAWKGTERISRKARWPTWTPPASMIRREPQLARYAGGMAGGPNNPLGARALYLGDTLYRIHGTNEPWTIGRAVSSGCFRMLNEDVIDLYERVEIGAKVIVR
jgi:lipoprotein-anchoring transpeptidase ErfK/SrfK